MIKCIIFDMDGVLINTEPLHYHIWQQICAEHGFTLEYDKYKGCIGSTIKYLFDLLLQNYGVAFHNDPAILKRFREIKEAYLAENGVPRIDGVPETVAALYRQGYILAVASSSSQDYIDFSIRELGIHPYFRLLFSGERVEHPKPAPDIFLEVAKRLRLQPSECLVVEDSCNGSRAARAAGMTCIGFRNPDSGDQDLSAADRTFYPFSALPDELPPKELS